MSPYLATHPQTLALLQEAKERPDDDTPRLVLADWLEDHGDPDRAEFIRLQLRLAPGVRLSPRGKCAMQHRTRELLDRHGGAWLGPLWRFWLSPVSWHRGLLSVGLSRRIAPASIIDALPWIDTVVFELTGRRSLESAGEILARTPLNHVVLDLRRPVSESSLLELLALMPVEPALRTLTWDWPVGMLRRSEGRSHVTPAASIEFLRRMSELPMSRHLTHLASLQPWTVEQADLIHSLGIEPVGADHKLWMHARTAGCFGVRTTTHVSGASSRRDDSEQEAP